MSDFIAKFSGVLTGRTGLMRCDTITTFTTFTSNTTVTTITDWHCQTGLRDPVFLTTPRMFQMSVSQSVSQGAKQMHLKEVQSYVGLLLNHRIDKLGGELTCNVWTVRTVSGKQQLCHHRHCLHCHHYVQKSIKIQPNVRLKTASNYIFILSDKTNCFALNTMTYWRT